MSERVTAIKTAMNTKLSLNAAIDIFPTKATLHDVVGAGFNDTVASVAGSTITLTGHASLVANSLAGYIVEVTSAANFGETRIIASNTSADPTVITLTVAPPADWDEDTIKIYSNYRIFLYETMNNRSDGLYKYYGFGCHVKGNTSANLDDIMEDILRFDSRSIYTSIRHTGTTLLEVIVTSFYPIIESDKFEGFIMLEGKWII